MSDYDGGGAIESVLAAAQSLSNNASNSAPTGVDPWWSLPILLAVVVGLTAATLWMVRREQRGR